MRPGDVQRMSAGTGIVHSEYNHSKAEPVHFLQIWIVPDRRGVTPGYEQQAFAPADRRGRLRLIASPDGRDGSVTLHQDARLHAALLAAGERVDHELAPERHAWIHVARGKVRMGDLELGEGDGAALGGRASIGLEGIDDAEVLLFDLG